MAGWTAANLGRSKRRRSKGDEAGDGEESDTGYEGDSDEHGQSSKTGKRRKKARRSAETAEAAIARLSSSYNAAMTAVGALHRASSAITKAAEAVTGRSTTKDMTAAAAAAAAAQQDDNDDHTEERMGQLYRVANAARSALGGAILLDPIVGPAYAPTWMETFQELGSKTKGNADGGGGSTRSGRQTLTSAAHRSTVKELAYLVLVNYGDLLTCGCCCCSRPMADKSKGGLLDRGTVRVLEALKIADKGGDEGQCRCCWGSEKEEDTKRLALVAYCDASELDRSDPTLWLKIACTARALGRIVFQRRVSELDGDDADSFSNPSPMLFDYSRLERYALESGVACLAPGVPPNRAITRALRELQAESEKEVTRYPSLQRPDPETSSLVIDLPRYSWSVAGRMLMRAFRMGGAYCDRDMAAKQVDETDYFGSPCIDIRFSSMLTLPTKVLGHICEYLEKKGGTLSRDVLSFECTCRALSADLVSARAVIEKTRHQKTAAAELGMSRHISDNEQGGEVGTNVGKDKDKEAAAAGDKDGDKEKEKKKKKKDDKQSQKPDDGKKKSARSHRSSKRVLSKKITSGKNAERSAKRKSVEYCLVSAIFSCTTRHPIYEACLKNEACWDTAPPCNREDATLAIASTPISPIKTSKTSHMVGDDSVGDSDSSLRSFVMTWSKQNSGASDILGKFLSHVSQHVVEVFSSEVGDTVALSSCILECYELATKRCGYRESLAPSWYGKDVFSPNDSFTEMIEVVSINLVNAELRLKRCERGGFDFDSFEDDSICLAYMVPQLLDLVSALTETKEDRTVSSESKESLQNLQIRCHWLAASFHLWQSRSASQLEVIRGAETAALQNIESAIECLAKADTERYTLSTPHLESPSRSGRHWRELSSDTLSSYKNELQASFVVSRARQQYQELKLHERARASTAGRFDVTEEETTILGEIATELLGRYGIDYEGLGGKHDELVGDLFKCHDADIIAVESSPCEQDEELPAQKWKSLWDVVALSPTQSTNLIRSTDVCLVSILSICTQSRDDTFKVMASLLSGLALAALDQYEQCLAKGRDDKGSQMPLTDRNAGESSDDFLSDSDDELLGGQKKTGLLETRDEERALLAARLFIEKLAELVSTCSEVYVVKEYSSSADFGRVMHKAVLLSSGKHDSSSTQIQLLKSPPKSDALNSISYLVSAIFVKVGDDQDAVDALSSAVFVALVEVLVRLRRSFPILLWSKSKGDQRIKRSKHQSVCLTYASFISSVASDIARLLSLNQSVLYSDGELEDSHLIKSLTSTSIDTEEGGTKSSSSAPSGTPPRDFSVVVQFTESLLWFWKFVINADVIDGSGDVTSPRPGITSVNAVHRATARNLVVPIASSIVSLCGAIGHGDRSSIARLFLASHLNEQDEQLASMSDYCDTDDSANAWFSDDDDTDEDNQGPDTRSSRCFLKVLLQSVQCCGLVFSGIHERLACSKATTHFLRASADSGPLLPVVVVRTLTNFADILLTVFGNEQADRRGAVWAEEYPYSTRSTGLQLDSLLHKAYRCLHGFTLSSQNSQAGMNCDLAIPSLPVSAQIDSSRYQFHPPESTKKAAQLYRCIRRAYPTKGRRSPPKSALECVAGSLPPAEETERSKAIRNFVFSRLSSPTLCTDENKEDATSSKEPESVELLPHFPVWVLSEDDSGTKDTPEKKSTSTAAEEDASPMPVIINPIEEIRLTRKGMCEELAQGALPRLGTGGSTAETAGKEKPGQMKNESLEREVTAQYEKELYEKFTAILNYLCYEPTDADSWYRAGLCLSFKADIICDRLTTPRGNDKVNAICVPNAEPKREESFPLSDLLVKQLEEHKSNKDGWVALLGSDLSPYIRYPWATLASLRSCSKKVRTFCQPNGEATDSEAATGSCSRDEAAWIEIEALFDKGDFVGWERAWGGLFVSAINDLLKKCFTTAHYLSVQEKHLSDDKDELCYEVAEAFATSYYAELMGGASYGYPMQLMTDLQRRKLAKESRAYFQAAIDFAVKRKLEENIHDLYFMIGKCEEKIAKTLAREAFPQPAEPTTEGNVAAGEVIVREYEKTLRGALESYAIAFKEMKKAEHDRSLADVQQGGSSHGIAEIVYRQHACRLKVLIAAVKQPKETRDAAEREALRITRAHWYSNPDEGAAYSPEKDVRDSVWEVLADCVAAMAKLRNDNQFFHRSVYRHAMALLWAPVLCDPETGYAQGSLGSVPATKSYHIRGLNTGDGACAKSAAAIISALFAKKRPQLCGVWVATTANPSSFEVLNDAVRKYDALRRKYVDAYIDIMRLCRRRDVLKTFLGWVDASQRDLPAFYDASAACGGAPPTTFHTKDSLLKGSGFLWTTKCRVNHAIAEILHQELSELEGMHDDSVRKRIDIFKEAYSCFLRLNTPLNDRIWKSQKVEDGAIIEVEVMCNAYTGLEGDPSSSTKATPVGPSNTTHKLKMSLLKSAVAKCEELFPSLVPSRKRAKCQSSKASQDDKTDKADSTAKDDTSSSTGLPISCLKGKGKDAGASGDQTEKSPKKNSAAGKTKKKKAASSTKEKSKEKTAAKKSKGTKTKPPKKSGEEGKSVTVDVPQGLKEGDIFDVTVDIGGGTTKNFKLRVPSGAHKKLKFVIPSSKSKKKAKSPAPKNSETKS